MISKQPNGLYCRISMVVDAPTFENASKSEVESYLRETQQLYDPLTVDEWLKEYAQPFDLAVSKITTLNMTQNEIDEWIKKVS
ncbi:hypothetical protein [Enterococcus sp. DIV0800]|uniref:hypothetical protein n=1 Tax=unclassified Enterococcus TaxID=2608891 RepID=UPI003D2FCE80